MPGAVTVLAYHRIATPGNRSLSNDLIDADPASFEVQMRFLASRYNVISSWDLVRAMRDGASLPPRAMIVTFDDGYRCFADTAWPTLKSLGLPVTLFVPTNFPERPGALFWWDAIYRAVMLSQQPRIELPGVGVFPLTTEAERQTAYERLVFAAERLPEQESARLVEQIAAAADVAPNSAPQMLLWDELMTLAEEGVTLGPHTQSHIILAQATPERIYSEVSGSWADLQAHVPRPLPLFAYPNGKPHALNAACADAVRRSGLLGSFTMIAGLNQLGRTNPFFMYRVGAVAGESLRRFAFKLTPTARAYRRLKGLLASRS